MNIFTNKNNLSSLDILKRVTQNLDNIKKKSITIVIFLSILSSIAELFSIALLIPFISFFFQPEQYLFNDYFKFFLSYFNIYKQNEILLIISIAFIFVVILGGFIRVKYIKMSNSLSDNIANDFRVKIFKFLINQNYSYHLNFGTNEILSNLSQKTDSFTTVVFCAINIINSSLICLVIISFLIIKEPFYTPIIIIIIMSFYFLIFKIRSFKILQEGKKIERSQNEMIDIFQNSVGYLPEIIVYNLKSFFFNILSKASLQTAESRTKIRSISMVPRIYLEVSIIVFAILAINFSGFISRPLEVNISFLAILVFGAQRCLPLINNIFSYSVNFKGHILIVENFLSILERKNENLVDEKTFIPLTLTFNNSIKLRNISFRYKDKLKNIINNFNFEIKKGEKVLIKGATGSGKSTLINIILGLLTPTQGSMFVDNTEINSKNIKNWQRNISIVPQTVFLNDATILENIAIGEKRDIIDLNKVKDAAIKAQIDNYISTLPFKYDQRVGERGIRLSGGQRQRIGIARALYQSRSLIILDEPTNALDETTEKMVMQSISNLDKEITFLFISHNNSTFKFFDKIINLDNL